MNGLALCGLLMYLSQGLEVGRKARAKSCLMLILAMRLATRAFFRAVKV